MGRAAPGSAHMEITIRFANGGTVTAEDIDLIEAVRRARSILGASKATGVSYRKCWLTVDALNRCFETPVFETFPGRRGGGAALTDFGARLVALYRSVERRAGNAAAPSLAELTAALDPDYQPRATSGAAAGRVAQPRPSRWQQS
ncbi:winged helix-turn-helix domain-containing protein [Methyloceanibacter sp. wino2]|uniref:winged helix-turn-helix domain-containing protein n=1 Tax=Methyloceanibacter sp. wino2 TaxID=2170729 RepID=UPI000D3E611A|nr:LysR family transcriptional regulator [Methyloceanibacter sp. wino2]